MVYFSGKGVVVRSHGLGFASLSPEESESQKVFKGMLPEAFAHSP